MANTEEKKNIKSCACPNNNKPKELIVITIETCCKRTCEGQLGTEKPLPEPPPKETPPSPAPPTPLPPRDVKSSPQLAPSKKEPEPEPSKAKISESGDGDITTDEDNTPVKSSPQNEVKVQSQKVERLYKLPILLDRHHGPGCAMEISVLEKHEDTCLYKKANREGRTIDDRVGSYDCIGRMVFRTCNPTELESDSSGVTGNFTGISPQEFSSDASNKSKLQSTPPGDNVPRSVQSDPTPKPILPTTPTPTPTPSSSPTPPTGTTEPSSPTQLTGEPSVTQPKKASPTQVSQEPPPTEIKETPSSPLEEPAASKEVVKEVSPTEAAKSSPEQEQNLPEASNTQQQENNKKSQIFGSPQKSEQSSQMPEKGNKPSSTSIYEDARSRQASIDQRSNYQSAHSGMTPIKEETSNEKTTKNGPNTNIMFATISNLRKQKIETCNKQHFPGDDCKLHHPRQPFFIPKSDYEPTFSSKKTFPLYSDEANQTDPRLSERDSQVTIATLTDLAKTQKKTKKTGFFSYLFNRGSNQSSSSGESKTSSRFRNDNRNFK